MTISNLRGAKCANNLSRSRHSTLPLASSHYRPCKGASPSIQTRNLWRCSQERYGSLNELAQRRMEKYHRLFPSKFRSRTTHLPRRPQTFHDNEHNHTPWWNQGWGWGRCKSSFPRFPNGRPAEEFWEAERARTQQRMEQIKKAIDADPYGAVFGRRLEPWTSLHNMENSISSLYRSVFGNDTTEGPKTVHTTARSSAAESPQKPESSVKASKASVSKAPEGGDGGDFEFDPISGRMSPRTAGSTKATGQDVPFKDMVERRGKDPSLNSERVGFLSAVEQSNVDTEKPVDIGMGIKANKREGDSNKQPPRVIHEDGEVSTVDTGKASHEPTEPLKPNDSGDTPASEPPHKHATEVIENGLLQSSSEIPSSEAAHQRSEIESQKPQKSSPADVNTNGYNAKERFGPSGFIAQAGQKPATSTFSDASRQSGPIYDQERAEDLDLLSASDIRTPYYPPVSRTGKLDREQTEQKDLHNSYDPHADPVGYLDAKTIRQKFRHYQKAPSEAPESKPPAQSAVDSSKHQIVSQPPVHDETTKAERIIEENSNVTQLSQSAASPPEIYQVLAYDPSTFKMTQAETSSSMSTSNEPLHLTEVLSLLNNPAKFMPHISKMHADGYEIVSGGGDVLVFRKELRPSHGQGFSCSADNVDAGVRNEPLFKESTFEHPTPAQEQETTHMGSSASPSPNLPSPIEQSPAGSQSSSDSDSKAGGPIRRMFIGGMATAATCYAISVVSEYFRTGGQDGRRIDGFTAFESERRQREREENAVPRV